MIFKKKELSLLWPFYFGTMVTTLSNMIVPFMMLYFLNIGLTFFQISIIYAANSATIFLFELITGGFADEYSRKYSVLLGFFLSGSTAIIIYTPTFI
ncbi:hypothetical protein HOK68_02975 [Candidatus Woesearchaeota archaeon]|jgi:MFS family permease|nr:hypothetical protein [Candidatus Woesearchaeota archaeon]MBT4387874.1 hypothetical protein [Candidatus Woesearchaeota archaeon]MBT4595693.1 hypothetical protein [Candidatus Woesearchaeota archaeon]MBT5741458.1 hypothetical protein [Candidatus Woesearchaeota archaeon]MBT6505716.1 hypothetical protein [Candidatus Woesearchaeota archaeon]